MRNLALFDFDGTITSRDTFTPFVMRAVGPARMAVGKVVLSPLIAAYELGLLPASQMGSTVVHFGLRGRRSADVHAAGRAYARGLDD